MPAPTGEPGTKVNLHVHMKEWRNHREMPLVAVGKLIDRSDRTINAWENGTRKMTLDDLAALAKAYGVPPEALFHSPAAWQRKNPKRKAVKAEPVRDVP